MTRNIVTCFLLCIALSACASAEQPTAVAESTTAPSATPTATATNTPTPTLTPTSSATSTAVSTNTPEPTPTSTPKLWATATAEYNDASIRTTFEELRTVIANDDIEGTLEFISSIDIEWYDFLLDDALSLDHEELATLELYQKFLVLWLRNNYSSEELENLTGGDVIVTFFERGWLSLSFLENLEISEVDIGIDPGNASVSFEGMPPSASLFLVREGGRHWRVFLGQFTSGRNAELEQLLRETGLTEDEFIIELIEPLSEKPVDERIFEGPIQ